MWLARILRYPASNPDVVTRRADAGFAAGWNGLNNQRLHASMYHVVQYDTSPTRSQDKTWTGEPYSLQALQRSVP